MAFLGTILGVTEILCSFRLVLKGKTGQEIPESLRLEFSEKFPAYNFALSDTEDNISGPLNRGGIAELLCWEHYWKFAKYPKSQVSRKWWTLLFHEHMQVWQLQEPFFNDYQPVWTLL